MNFGTILLSCFIFFASTVTEASGFQCESQRKISEELIEAELSGVRLQGKVSTCLKQENFRSVLVVHQELGDGALLKPKYTLKRGAVVTIEQETTLPGDVVDVTYSFETKDGIKVHDKLSYLLNFGKKIKRKGCGSILQEPAAFSMREECL